MMSAKELQKFLDSENLDLEVIKSIIYKVAMIDDIEFDFETILRVYGADVAERTEMDIRC